MFYKFMFSLLGKNGGGRKLNVEELEAELKRLIKLHDETDDPEARKIFKKHCLEIARQIGEICLQKKTTEA